MFEILLLCPLLFVHAPQMLPGPVLFTYLRRSACPNWDIALGFFALALRLMFQQAVNIPGQLTVSKVVVLGLAAPRMRRVGA